MRQSAAVGEVACCGNFRLQLPTSAASSWKSKVRSCDRVSQGRQPH
ncbi:hypothetical protein [Nostoc sp.]